MQPVLFQTEPKFDGETVEKQDEPRLRRQLGSVQQLMSDGRWRGLAEIASHVGCSEASASARLRDLRKEKFGGYVVERQRLRDGSGLFFYRLVMPKE